MIELGTYISGEIPPTTLRYVYEDVNGQPIPLDDFTTAIFVFRADGVDVTRRDAAIDADPSTGAVIYDWQDGDIFTDDDISLSFTAEFWVIGSASRLASRKIRWFVDPSVLDEPPELVGS